jgi:hypothetical protein
MADRSCVVAPLLHEYESGAVPPDTDTSTEPLARLHNALVTVADAVGDAMLVTAVLCATVHPAASVTVSEYDPAATLVSDCDDAPLLHAYVYGAVPRETFAVTSPFAFPHVDGCGVIAITGDVDAATVADVVAVQPSADVTVTE